MVLLSTDSLTTVWQNVEWVFSVDWISSANALLLGFCQKRRNCLFLSYKWIICSDWSMTYIYVFKSPKNVIIIIERSKQKTSTIKKAVLVVFSFNFSNRLYCLPYNYIYVWKWMCTPKLIAFRFKWVGCYLWIPFVNLWYYWTTIMVR